MKSSKNRRGTVPPLRTARKYLTKRNSMHYHHVRSRRDESVAPIRLGPRKEEALEETAMDNARNGARDYAGEIRALVTAMGQERARLSVQGRVLNDEEQALIRRIEMALPMLEQALRSFEERPDARMGAAT